MSEPVIRVENLGKKYTIHHNQAGGGQTQLLSEKLGNMARGKISRPETEDFWALRGLTFEINKGDVLGIIGRNGAGKSTLLKILSRITEASEGRVELRGRVASLLEVGTGFHPELTGRENIYLNGAILGMSRREIRQRFDEIVAFSEVEQFLDTPIKRYSSGMRVRLAFSVAAHLEPEILIIDEVLAVGDHAFQKKCLGKMRDVSQGGGRTVLFVSHQLAMVRQLCSQAILLEQGQLEMQGQVEEVLSTYYQKLEEHASVADNAPFRVEVISETAQGEEPTLTLGEPCRFRFTLPEGPKINELSFGIYNEEGNMISHFNTRFASKNDPTPEAIGKATTLECSLDQVLLTPGRYRMNVRLSREGSEPKRWQDAALFYVQAAAINGRVLQGGMLHGIMAMPHEWSTV